MELLTEERPLDFWNRLLVRIQREFEQGLTRLPLLSTPIEASADSLPSVLAQVQSNQGAVRALLTELENLQVLARVLAPQLGRVTFDAGIPYLEQRISAHQRVADMFRQHMCQRPLSQVSTQELTIAAARLDALRTAGQGESIVAERNRLRAMVRQIPIVSAEDGVLYEAAVRKLDSEIDMMDSELQSLRIGTLVQLRIAAVLAPTLTQFGVGTSPLAVAAPTTEPVEPV